MSNIVIINDRVRIQPIVKEIESRFKDWHRISSIKGVGGKVETTNFLPLAMAVVKPGCDIKSVEESMHTPFYQVYVETVKWLRSVNCGHHSRAAFIRLTPGSSNSTHIDEGNYYKSRDRYHLALMGKYRYVVGEEEMIVHPGTFFWFNNKIPHASYNIGDVDRIALVFDVPHGPNNPHHRRVHEH